MTDKISDEEFQAKVKTLDCLMQQREELSGYIKELITIYKIDPSLFTPDIWFDLVNPPKTKQQENDSMLGILELRARFREKHNAEAEKLVDLNQEIRLNNIDVALEKIKIFQKDLGPEE